MKKRLPSWAALLIVCLLAGGLVIGANRLTADRIARQPNGAKDAPAQAADTLSASRRGYGGEVTATVRLAADGTIESMTVDTPDETDGLGKKCSEPQFTRQFLGKAAPFAYGQDGIEAVYGATVTSNAVLDALNGIVPPETGT